MSDGFLADSVDMMLASLYSFTRATVFSELHSLLASLERHAKLTCCLSAVAELLVNPAMCHQWLPAPSILPTDRHCAHYKCLILYLLYCVMPIANHTVGSSTVS